MRSIACFFLLFLLFNNSHAQKTKLFYDEYGLQGRVNYSGNWSDSALPQNGRYELKWRSFADGNLYTYNTLGRLGNGLLTGKWIWEQAAWSYTIEPGRSLEPSFNSKGERQFWDANFRNGKPNGLWRFTVDSIPLENKNRNNNLQITANYENGVLTGKFSIKDSRPGKAFSAEGQCNKSGVAVGQWVFQFVRDSTKYLEVRKYESGILTEVLYSEIRGKDTANSLLRYAETEEQLHALKNTQESLPYKIGSMEFETDGYESKGKQFFKEYFDGLFLQGWDLPVFHAEFERKAPVFKKIQYPLSEKEKEYIERAKEKIAFVRAELQKRETYQNIELNRGRSNSLDIAVAYIEGVSEKIRRIDSLLDRTTLPLFTYKNRFNPELLAWHQVVNKDTFARAVFFENEFATFPLLNLQEQEEGIFASVYQYVLRLEEELSPYFAETDNAYKTIQKEGELLAIESEMTHRLHILDSLYAESTGMSEIVRKKWTQAFMRQLFQTYSREDDYEKSKTLAGDILGKIDTLMAWRKDWTVFDSMQIRLKELYTVYEYNPYTGKRDIEVRKKRRFYNKISGQFLPWMTEELNNAQTWEEWTELKIVSMQVYAYLADFSTQEDKASKRVEKRVRSEKSSEKILRTIQSNMKTGEKIGFLF